MTEKEMQERIESLQNRMSACEETTKEYKEAFKYLAQQIKKVKKYLKLMEGAGWFQAKDLDDPWMTDHKELYEEE